MTGILDIPAAAYHDDPCDQPSLSASIAHILCTSSPRHAWAAHPRLNPDFARQEEQHFDLGTAAHALLLEDDGGPKVEVVDKPDWRTDAAKEARDAARAAGMLPLLAKHWGAVEAMVTAALAQIREHDADPPLFTDGKPERTLVWQEDGIWCRSRLDWLRDDLTAVDDLKTTSRSADPDAWVRGPMLSTGAYVKAAFYLRGIRSVTGAEPEFRWVIAETSPPYALSVVSPGPDVMALADAKVDWALATWRRCLSTNEWPAYTPKVCYAELPTWEETRWLEREAREEQAA